MKQQRLSLCLLFLIGFCGLVLRFPAAQISAEETPVPSATLAAQAAAQISPTPTPTPERPSVRWVGVRDSNGEKRKEDKAYAGRGDEIWVDVINFEEWVRSLGDKKPPNHEEKDHILYLNHVPLKGVHPFYWYENTWEIAPSVTTTDTTFGFSLVRNEKSKEGWSHLLNKPGFNRKVIVSVGFENGQEIRSELTPDETTPKDLKELQDERESILSSSDLSLSDKHALEVIDQKVEVETTLKNLKELQ